MKINEFYSELIDEVIAKQKDKIENVFTFCCGTSGNYQVIETEKLELIFKEGTKLCELRRNENDNPVVFRKEEGEIYRLHGETGYLKKELYELAGRDTTELNPDYKYD